MDGEEWKEVQGPMRRVCVKASCFIAKLLHQPLVGWDGENSSTWCFKCCLKSDACLLGDPWQCGCGCRELQTCWLRAHFPLVPLLVSQLPSPVVSPLLQISHCKLFGARTSSNNKNSSRIAPYSMWFQPDAFDYSQAGHDNGWAFLASYVLVMGDMLRPFSSEHR